MIEENNVKPAGDNGEAGPEAVIFKEFEAARKKREALETHRKKLEELNRRVQELGKEGKRVAEKLKVEAEKAFRELNRQDPNPENRETVKVIDSKIINLRKKIIAFEKRVVEVEGLVQKEIKKEQVEAEKPTVEKKMVPSAKAMERVGRVREEIETKLNQVEEASPEKERLVWLIRELAGEKDSWGGPSVAWTEIDDVVFAELFDETKSEVEAFVKKSLEAKELIAKPAPAEQIEVRGTEAPVKEGKEGILVRVEKALSSLPAGGAVVEKHRQTLADLRTKEQQIARLPEGKEKHKQMKRFRKEAEELESNVVTLTGGEITTTKVEVLPKKGPVETMKSLVDHLDKLIALAEENKQTKAVGELKTLEKEVGLLLKGLESLGPDMMKLAGRRVAEFQNQVGELEKKLEKAVSTAAAAELAEKEGKIVVPDFGKFDKDRLVFDFEKFGVVDFKKILEPPAVKCLEARQSGNRYYFQFATAVEVEGKPKEIVWGFNLVKDKDEKKFLVTLMHTKDGKEGGYADWDKERPGVFGPKKLKDYLESGFIQYSKDMIAAEAKFKEAEAGVETKTSAAQFADVILPKERKAGWREPMLTKEEAQKYIDRAFKEKKIIKPEQFRTDEEIIIAGTYWKAYLESKIKDYKKRYDEARAAIEKLKAVFAEARQAERVREAAKKLEAAARPEGAPLREAEARPITPEEAEQFIQRAVDKGDMTRGDAVEVLKKLRDTIFSGAYWRARYEGKSDKEAYMEGSKVIRLYEAESVVAVGVEPTKFADVILPKERKAGWKEAKASEAMPRTGEPGESGAGVEAPTPVEAPEPTEGKREKKKGKKIIDIKESVLLELIKPNKLQEVINELVLGNDEVAEVLFKDIFSRDDIDLEALREELKKHGYDSDEFKTLWSEVLYQGPFKIIREDIEQKRRNWLAANTTLLEKVNINAPYYLKQLLIQVAPTVAVVGAVSATAVTAGGSILARAGLGALVGGAGGALRGIKNKVERVKNWFGKKSEKAKVARDWRAAEIEEKKRQSEEVRQALQNSFNTVDLLKEMSGMLSQGLRDASARQMAAELGKEAATIKANVELAVGEVKEAAEEERKAREGVKGEKGAKIDYESQGERAEALIAKLYNKQEMEEIITEALKKDPSILSMFKKLSALQSLDLDKLYERKVNPQERESAARKTACILASTLAGAGMGAALASTPELRILVGAIVGGYLGAKYGHKKDIEARKRAFEAEITNTVHRAEDIIEKYESVKDLDAWLGGNPQAKATELQAMAKDLRVPLTLSMLKGNTLEYRAQNALRRVEAIYLGIYLRNPDLVIERMGENVATHSGVENLLTALNTDVEELSKAQGAAKERLMGKRGKWRTIVGGVSGALAGAVAGYGLTKLREYLHPEEAHGGHFGAVEHRPTTVPPEIAGRGAVVAAGAGVVEVARGVEAVEAFDLSRFIGENHLGGTKAEEMLKDLLNNDHYPELNNPESLQHILDAARVGDHIHSAHADVIKSAIDTLDEGGGERNTAIFEEILKHGGPEHAAKFLESQHLGSNHLAYLPNGTKTDYLAFVKQYEITVLKGGVGGNKEELIGGLFRALRGKESTNLANAGLERDATATQAGLDVRAYGKELEYFGLDGKRPILAGDGGAKLVELTQVRAAAPHAEAPAADWHRASAGEVAEDGAGRDYTPFVSDDKAIFVRGDNAIFSKDGQMIGMMNEEGHPEFFDPRHPYGVKDADEMDLDKLGKDVGPIHTPDKVIYYTEQAADTVKVHGLDVDKATTPTPDAAHQPNVVEAHAEAVKAVATTKVVTTFHAEKGAATAEPLGRLGAGKEVPTAEQPAPTAKAAAGVEAEPEKVLEMAAVTAPLQERLAHIDFSQIKESGAPAGMLEKIQALQSYIEASQRGQAVNPPAELPHLADALKEYQAGGGKDLGHFIEALAANDEERRELELVLQAQDAAIAANKSHLYLVWDDDAQKYIGRFNGNHLYDFDPSTQELITMRNDGTVLGRASQDALVQTFKSLKELDAIE